VFFPHEVCGVPVFMADGLARPGLAGESRASIGVLFVQNAR
jgi:hypothetical protein